MLQDLSVVLGLVAQERKFVPPLAESEEQREQEHAYHEPWGDRNIHSNSARICPDHEAHGERDRIDDYDVFQVERVGEALCQVCKCCKQEKPMDVQRQSQTHHEQGRTE